MDTLYVSRLLGQRYETLGPISLATLSGARQQICALRFRLAISLCTTTFCLMRLLVGLTRASFHRHFSLSSPLSRLHLNTSQTTGS